MHKNESGIIMACHIAGVYDVNRNHTVQPDDYTQVKEWVESIIHHNLSGILFHNHFSSDTLEKNNHKNIQFIQIEYDQTFNPNVFRYFVYQDFLKQQGHTIKHLFLTDVSDVVVVKNPFIDPFFLKRPDTIFCGDEPKMLNDEWMHAHSTHLRSHIPGFSIFESNFQHETLLNCGIAGGPIHLMLDLLQSLCDLHRSYNQNNKTAFTGDMGAFNYILRTQFNDCIHHGFPCNTTFKGYELNRTDCWFRHK